MANGRVTLEHIAEASGVSKATVSLVMRESPQVADSTRERVLRTATDLGYVYNRAAASLRSKRTGTFGLIVNSVGNPFFAEVVEGVESRFTESGRTLLLSQHSESVAVQRKRIEVMLENRVDGVLLVPAHGTPVDHVERLRNAGVATVMVTRRVDGIPVPYVGSDNVAGGRQAGEHLIGHGCTRVAFVGGVKGTSAFREREDGLLAAIARTGGGVSVASHPSPGTPEAAYIVTRDLLSTGEQLDGILAYNDIVATGICAAIQDSGRTVGGDVKVIGFDDIAASRFLRPSLTSVNSRPSLIGSVAADALVRLLSDPTADEAVIVPNSLSIRHSCGCANVDSPVSE
jgi:LacI family transcriptional regulator